MFTGFKPKQADLFSAPAVAQDTGNGSKRSDQDDQRQVRVGVETTGNILSNGLTVKSDAEAADFLSFLIDKPQKNLYTVTVDKNGKALEVNKYSKGGKGSSVAIPSEIAGRVLNIKGAKKVFFVQNHPAGDPNRSQSDIAMLDSLKTILGLQDIKISGLVVTKQNGQQVFQNLKDYTNSPVSEESKTQEILVKERVFEKDKPGEKMTPQLADDFLKDKPAGVLFLNNAGNMVSFLHDQRQL